MKEEYILTDGERFIRKNIHDKYEVTYNPSLADTYPTVNLASAILNNALSKALRTKFFIGKIKGENIVPCNIKPSKKRYKKVTHKPTDGFKYETSNSMEVDEWLSKIEDLKLLFSKAKERSKEIDGELAKIEGEKNDLVHCVEFNKFNAAQGYKAYHRLHITLNKRRNLKNEKRIIEAVNKITDVEVRLREVFEEIKAVKEQKYAPRELIDLFSDNVI